jgi:two-component system response regulator YesN
MPLERVYKNVLGSISQLSGIETLLGKQFLAQYNENIQTIIGEVNSPDETKKSLCKIIQNIGLNIYSDYSVDVTEQTMYFTRKIDSAETLADCVSDFHEFVVQVGEKVRQKSIYSTDISNAIKYIHQHFTDNVTLNDVANNINMSPSYFSNLFKKETNVNFVEYLNTFRVEKAKRMLQNTDLKAYEIAEKVGFSENTYFCKVFKKITGMSPNEFRKNNAQMVRNDKSESF